jgi:TPP-dependent pyruvate/acetoin dehydrogenase alpha subunit
VLRLLSDDGRLDVDESPPIALDRAAALYASMVRAAVLGERLSALAASGRIGFFPSTLGTEAAVVGASFALREQDWIFPTHGDFAAAVTRGLSVRALAERVCASANDPLKGRDLPAGSSARAQRIASVSAPAGTHLPHAVGFAWAAQQRGEDVVTAAFFDAPEVDAADFHTGLNFAGVMGAPTVFLCRVRPGQAGAAEHAIAYGLPYLRCDGSDALAVVRAVGDAVERAAEGRGATVVDLELGEDADAPLQRLRAYLEREGAWDEARERSLRLEVAGELERAVEEASRASVSRHTLVDDVYGRPTAELERQRAELASGPRPTKT